MSTISPTLPDENVPALPKAPSVVMGRQDYLSVLLRLTAMELYKIRRRVLSKVLAVIGIVIVALAFLGIGIYVNILVNTPAAKLAPPLCSQIQIPGCLIHQPTQAELAQYKQQTIQNTSASLRLPDSLGVAVILSGFVTPLMIILAGILVGGEYSLGTIRLLFTRGPTRLQFLLAKLLTLPICAAVGLLILMLVGVLVGYALNPLSGIAPSFSFLTASWFGYALLYVLTAILNWFVYAIIALFFGSLGRSTVAGVVGGLIWFYLEPLLDGIASVASLANSSLRDIVKTVHENLISTNINALLQNQLHSLGGGNSSSLSNLHAMTVLAIYCLVFIGLSCWLTLKRDVTH